jgi:hypothetical protein
MNTARCARHYTPWRPAAEGDAARRNGDLLATGPRVAGTDAQMNFKQKTNEISIASF